MVRTIDGGFQANCVILVTGVTSADEQFLPELKIYPNPFTGVVRIVGAAAVAETLRATSLQVQVIDAAGAIVHTQTITGDDEIINLEHLPTGVYIFRFEKDGNVKTVKVIREQ